jgi:hypothetical protein
MSTVSNLQFVSIGVGALLMLGAIIFMAWLARDRRGR